MSREISLIFDYDGLFAGYSASGEAAIRLHKAALPNLCAATTIPHS